MRSFVVHLFAPRRPLLEVSKVNKQLRDAIGRATTRVNMAAGIVTSILPEVIRINLARVLGPYLGQPEQQRAASPDAAGCPFSGAAAQQPPAQEAKCPFTGQSASDAAQTAPENNAKQTDATQKPSQKKPQSEAKAVESAKPAAKKAAAKTEEKAAAAEKKPEQKKAAKPKASADKKAAPKKAAVKKEAAKTDAAPKSAATKEAPKTQTAAHSLTAAELKKYTRDQLATVAQELNIAGRSSMRKAELLDAVQKELKLT